MNLQVVLFATIFGSFLFKQMLSRKVRDFLVPWAFAYDFLVVVVIGTVQSQGGVFHFAFTALNFFPVMILCEGFTSVEMHRNPAWGAFLFFYLFMCLIGFTGYFPIDGVTFYLQCFISTFCTGFFTARWVCRTEDGLQKLLFPLLVVSWIAVAYYVVRQGSLSMELDEYGRMDMSELNQEVIDKVNVNGIALRMCSIMPLVLLGFVRFKRKIFKLLSLGSFILLALVTVRTGSRNGMLGMLPIAWFLLHGSRGTKIRAKAIVSLVFVGIMFAVGVLVTNKGVSAIRAFDFKGKEQDNVYGSVMDRISTGRWTMYITNLEKLTFNELVFGKGCSLSQYSHRGERIERFRGANAHSNYMTILYRSGIVGLCLFVISAYIFFMQANKLGWRGNLAKLLYATWFFVGVGESWGMNGGIIAILAGMGMGLVSLKPATNSEFGELGRMGWMRPGFRSR